MKDDFRNNQSFSQRIFVSLLPSAIIILFFSFHFSQMGLININSETYFLIITISSFWILLGVNILILYYSGNKLFLKNMNQKLMTKKERLIIFFLLESIIIFSFLTIFLLHLLDIFFINPIRLTYGGFLIAIILIIVFIINSVNKVLKKNKSES